MGEIKLTQEKKFMNKRTGEGDYLGCGNWNLKLSGLFQLRHFVPNNFGPFHKLRWTHNIQESGKIFERFICNKLTGNGKESSREISKVADLLSVDFVNHVEPWRFSGIFSFKIELEPLAHKSFRAGKYGSRWSRTPVSIFSILLSPQTNTSYLRSNSNFEGFPLYEQLSTRHKEKDRNGRKKLSPNCCT